MRPHEPTHHCIGNIAAHTIIDAPSRLDQLGVKAEILCLIDKIVGIDADAVSADQSRGEAQRIPLRIHRIDDLARIDIHTVKRHRELIHESNIDVALRVLRHLRRLGNADGGCAVNALHHRAVDSCNRIECRRIHPGDDLDNVLQTVDRVARVDALRRIPHLEIRTAAQSRLLFEQRKTDVLRHPGIDR